MNKQIRILLLSFVIIFCVSAVFSGEGQIDIAKLPYTISSSGSYIVVGELELSTTGNHGITIAADNVTLDLNGHTIKGPGQAAATTDSGIYIGSSVRNGITVKNGSILEWPDIGINGTFARASNFSNLKCFNNGKHGILTSTSCIISENLCYGNTDHGISVNDGSTVMNNICHDNIRNGIVVSQGCNVTGNSCYSNDGDGIDSSNGNLIKSNTLSYNKGNGINCYLNNKVEENICRSNGFMGDAAGILIKTSGNSVEKNLVTGNTRGIECNPVHGKNFIASNRASGNGTDFDITISKNVVGKIVDMSSTGGEITTSDPFTNFIFH